MIHCQGCGEQISEDAPTCPKCGKPNASASKGISTGVKIGIFFLPPIFAWFTLKKGVSTTTRVVAFVWMAIYFGVLMNDNGKGVPEDDAQAVTEATTCQGLSSHVIELSKEKGGPFKVEMLKMYDIEEVSPAGEGRVLDCTADIKWDRGDNSRYRFFIEEDAEGTQFYGYEPIE